MPSNFDQAFERVKQLVADFQANEKFYLSQAYQEQEARHDFIDKFWIALGWDVNHDTQKNPYEQEVKVERKAHGTSQCRADYAFSLGPKYTTVKFYVEAKKPYGDIATVDNYFQVIKYGWGGQTPVGVLHDFEQFEIVDCRYMPLVETALQQNIRKYHYRHYLDKEKFAEIYWLFSREAVATGSLEKLAQGLPKRRRKTKGGLFQESELPADEAFLAELDNHRDVLARSFKSHNPGLDGETLTELTQRTLDRLVFLRFLEDKQIEPHNRIAYFGDKGTAWRDFIAESRRLNGIYNGIVYKEHALLDSPKFKVDDGAFLSICKNLCHPNSRYNFNCIPIHILGSIYERFLGKIIVATGKRAHVDEKPEVRKAGGVYYTPEYIVTYIVENTVGKLIEGKTPAQIAEMRFADIACGSGSFLLGIFECLILYHNKYYNDNPTKRKKGDCEERDDGWHLSLHKKREILLRNIFGVDIDAQAVEVAQLSLYLKLLEDETPGSARQYLLDFEQQALLPGLSKNIVCGNSLVGTDILDGQLFASDEERKLNPMNFEDAFPQIFRRKAFTMELHEPPPSAPIGFDAPGMPLHGSFSYKIKKGKPAGLSTAIPKFEGGFDAIVGNPPYVFGRDWKNLKIPEFLKPYFKNHYSASPYQLDFFSLFMERGTSKLRLHGRFGMIVPDIWLTNTYSALTRRYIFGNAQELRLSKAPNDVFGKIIVDTIVTTFTKTANPDRTFETCQIQPAGMVDLESHKSEPFADGARPIALGGCQLDNPLIGKILATGFTLGDEVELTRGVHPYRADGFGESAFGKGCQTERDVLERPYHSTKQKPGYHGFVYGKDIQRLTPPIATEYIKYGPWLAEPRTPKFFEGRRVYSRKILSDRLVVTVETKPTVADQQVYISKPTRYDAAYLAGVLGSRLIGWFIRSYFDECTQAFPQIKVAQLRAIPIPKLDPGKPADKSRHDRMIQLVEQMLEARKQLSASQTDKDKNYFEGKCDSLDRQIDSLVYELYGLTEKEIKLVEDNK